MRSYSDFTPLFEEQLSHLCTGFRCCQISPFPDNLGNFNIYLAINDQQIGSESHTAAPKAYITILLNKKEDLNRLRL